MPYSHYLSEFNQLEKSFATNNIKGIKKTLKVLNTSLRPFLIFFFIRVRLSDLLTRKQT